MSPRTKEQFGELREASIKKILDASLELFGTVGYESTTMSAIAKRAGISKGLIYNYFDSKEELLRGLIDSLVKLGEDMLSDAMSKDPRKTLEGIIRMTFKWLRENEKLNRLMINLMVQVDRFDYIHDISNTKMKEYVVMLEQWLEKIDFPNHRTEARILATIFDGISIQYLILKDDYPLDEIEQMLINKYCK